MTNEELVQEIQNGAEDKLPELWGHVERLARYHANRYVKGLTRGGIDSNPSELFDDLFYGCGYPALVEAVKTFDCAAGTAFTGWYSFYFKQQVYQMQGWRWRVDSKTGEGKTIQLDAAGHSCSLDAPVAFGDDGSEATLGELTPDPRSEAEFDGVDVAIFHQQLHDALEDALSTLPHEQADAVRGTYFDGLTLREMAEKDGITPNAVMQRQKKGMRALRNPKHTRILKSYLYPDGDIYAAAVQGNGVGAFKNSGMSRVEQIVFAMDAGKEI